MRRRAPLTLALALCAGCATPHLVVESAWEEAIQRAGIEDPAARPPEVHWGATGSTAPDCDPRAEAAPRVIARYLPDLDRVEVLSVCARPIHPVLVHEFLHAIRERGRRAQSGILVGYEPEGEVWVQERAARPVDGRAPATAAKGRPDSAERSSRDPSDPATSLR